MPVPSTFSSDQEVVQFDGRPGQQHDGSWSGRPGENSSQMLDAVGLRDSYERLKFESGRRKVALEWLLRTRDSVPGAQSIHLHPPDTEIVPVEPDVQTLIAVEPPLGNPSNWDKGEYCPIVGRDMPKVREALQSFKQLEGITLARLNDDEACTVWNIADARGRMADQIGSAISGIQLVPKAVLVESPWMRFGESGRIAFRVYPGGDATARPSSATVFAFMSRPPGLSFTFVLRLGKSLSTAPRLWMSSKTNYRLDLGWVLVEKELLAHSPDEKFPLTLYVVQWHGPEDILEDRPIEDRWSSTTALDVLEGISRQSDASIVR